MNANETPTWPDLAVGLYDRLTGRGAEITYEFDGMSVVVPSSSSDGDPKARWKLDGTVRVRTRDVSKAS